MATPSKQLVTLERLNAIMNVITLPALGFALKLLIDLQVTNAELTERVTAIQNDMGNIRIEQAVIKQDAAISRGIINSNGNRITRLEALLPDRNQFQIRQ